MVEERRVHDEVAEQDVGGRRRHRSGCGTGCHSAIGGSRRRAAAAGRAHRTGRQRRRRPPPAGSRSRRRALQFSRNVTDHQQRRERQRAGPVQGEPLRRLLLRVPQERQADQRQPRPAARSSRNSSRHEPAASSPAPSSGPTAAEMEIAEPVRPLESPSLPHRHGLAQHRHAVGDDGGADERLAGAEQDEHGERTARARPPARTPERPPGPRGTRAPGPSWSPSLPPSGLGDGHGDEVGRDQPGDLGVADGEVVDVSPAGPRPASWS